MKTLIENLYDDIKEINNLISPKKLMITINEDEDSDYYGTYGLTFNYKHESIISELSVRELSIAIAAIYGYIEAVQNGNNR